MCAVFPLAGVVDELAQMKERVMQGNCTHSEMQTC
jgi:hypothetical protein